MGVSRLLAAAGLLVWLGGCSPLIGAIMAAAEGDGGDIRAGQSVSGSTSGAGDRWSPSCGGSNAGDRAYVFVPERSSTYRVEADGQYDCLVAVFDESHNEIACNDDSGETTHSMVETHLEAGRRYTIVVDGFSSSEGRFRMSLTDLVPDGPVIDERQLLVGQRGEGDTSQGQDRLTPPCGATALSPDDTWTFTPIQAGTYVIDMDSEYDGVLAVYAPGDIATPIACNDDHGSTRASQVTPTLQAGVAYQIVVDGYHGNSGRYGLVVSQPGQGGSGTTASGQLVLDQPRSGDTSGASDQRQPSCGSRPLTPDQSFTFRPTAAGVVRFHIDAQYDSLLAVYDGAAEIACNDDYQGTRMSRVEVQVHPGRDYHVVVDGWGGGSGAYILTATDVSVAVTPSTGPRIYREGQLVEGDTQNGSDTRTFSCGTTPGSPDEIWSFTPSSSGRFAIQVDAQYDSVLAVYAAGSPAEIGCNDDHGSTRRSRIETDLVAGQAYEIVIDGYRGATGRYRLQVNSMGAASATPATPENTAELELRCASAPTVRVGTTMGALTPSTAHATLSCGPSTGPEAVYRVQFPQSGSLTVRAQSSRPLRLELRQGCSINHTVVTCQVGTLSAQIAGGQTYYLIVDSDQPGALEFTLDTSLRTP